MMVGHKILSDRRLRELMNVPKWNLAITMGVCQAGITIPLACKYAFAAKVITRQAKPTDAGKEIDELELALAVFDLRESWTMLLQGLKCLLCFS